MLSGPPNPFAAAAEADRLAEVDADMLADTEALEARDTDSEALKAS